MAKEKGKASFILYFEYKDYFEQLSVEERGELITAIFDYVVTGETKKLKGASEMAFATFSTPSPEYEMERVSMP